MIPAYCVEGLIHLANVRDQQTAQVGVLERSESEDVSAVCCIHLICAVLTLIDAFGIRPSAVLPELLRRIPTAARFDLISLHCNALLEGYQRGFALFANWKLNLRIQLDVQHSS